MAEEVNMENGNGIGQVIEVDFADHMVNQFLGYAMDVIKGRALPDVRDGLKPVHRHILYAMYELGLHPSSQYKKCARSVGETLGKYHPHGDQSVYDALVVMAQDFKLRYPMIDGHGNFGSVDGDPAAAMRYTESRLSKYGELMMADVDKATVDFVPNYDESEKEPAILPGLFPALLCNGTSGIAVGMAASFLPHSASAVFKAIDRILECAIDDNVADIEELIKIVQAPDFPTGGVIVNQPEVWKAYREGKGRCIVRAKYHIEQWGRKNDKDAIVVTELPYDVNKAKLVSSIQKLMDNDEENEFAEIEEIRDESDRTGMRVVIELKKDAQTNIVINRLLKKTDMQKGLSMNHVALVNGHPKHNLTLEDLLSSFTDHAITVCQNKVKFQSEKLSKRAHILEALILALNDADATIELLKASSRQKALSNLKEAYKFDDEQAEAVAGLRFYALNDEDKEKLENEYLDVDNRLKSCYSILGDLKELLKYTRQELDSVREKYFSKDTRLTEISAEMGDRETIPDMDVVIAYTHSGYIKCVKLDEYNAQKRNGKGNSFKTKENDFVESVHTLSTHDDLVLITTFGKAYVLPAYKIPTVSKSSVGKLLSNYIQLAENEEVVKLFVVTRKDREANKSMLMVTKLGIGKRMSLDDLPQTRNGARVITMKSDEDELVSAALIDNDTEIAVVSAMGQTLRFAAECVSLMGRAAAGVKVMNLKNEGDYVVSAFTATNDMTLLQVMSGGNAKRVKVEDIPLKKNRGSSGVTGLGNPEKVGTVVAAVTAGDGDDVIVITQAGMIIRTPVSSISLQGRTANGVKLINLEDDDTIASVTVVASEKIEEEVA